MRNLIFFLVKNYFYFLFILLEIVSFLLLVNNNNYQQSSVFNSTNSVVGSIVDFSGNISDYFDLKYTNEQLANENIKIRKQAELNQFTLDTSTQKIYDSLYIQHYEYITAKIINNSVSKRNNYITLNKGKKTGIKTDMGVISSNGIVGIIRKCSDNFSSILPVLHSKSTISVKLKNKNYFGSLRWDGKDYREGTVEHIPAHVEINKGDTFVSSGYSSMFPAGILAGTILNYKKDKAGKFYRIQIRFTEDYNRLSHVYVIQNLLKEEQIIVEKTEKND